MPSCRGRISLLSNPSYKMESLTVLLCMVLTNGRCGHRDSLCFVKCPNDLGFFLLIVSFACLDYIYYICPNRIPITGILVVHVVTQKNVKKLSLRIVYYVFFLKSSIPPWRLFYNFIFSDQEQVSNKSNLIQGLFNYFVICQPNVI